MVDIKMGLKKIQTMPKYVEYLAGNRAKAITDKWSNLSDKQHVAIAGALVGAGIVSVYAVKNKKKIGAAWNKLKTWQKAAIIGAPVAGYLIGKKLKKF